MLSILLSPIMIKMGITYLKFYLFQYFQTKDFNRFKYFLDIEVAKSDYVLLYERPYTFLKIWERWYVGSLALLQILMLNSCKNRGIHSMSLEDKNSWLVNWIISHWLEHTIFFIKIKLTRLYISFQMSVYKLCHWNAVVRILQYVKSTSGRYLDMQTWIEHNYLFIDVLHQNIVFY